MHWNPVKKGLCERPEEYPWSSAADYIIDEQKGVVRIRRELAGTVMR